MIDTATLQRQITLMMAKLHEIAGIPKLHGNGNDFVGIEFGDGGVLYRSETYFSGCGTESYSFHTLWEEINEPISYFQNKYAEQITRDEIEKRDAKAAELQKAENNERELAVKLKEKYNL